MDELIKSFIMYGLAAIVMFILYVICLVLWAIYKDDQ